MGGKKKTENEVIVLDDEGGNLKEKDEQHDVFTTNGDIGSTNLTRKAGRQYVSLSACTSVFLSACLLECTCGVKPIIQNLENHAEGRVIILTPLFLIRREIVGQSSRRRGALLHPSLQQFASGSKRLDMDLG